MMECDWKAVEHNNEHHFAQTPLVCVTKLRLMLNHALRNLVIKITFRLVSMKILDCKWREVIGEHCEIWVSDIYRQSFILDSVNSIYIIYM